MKGEDIGGSHTATGEAASAMATPMILPGPTSMVWVAPSMPSAAAAPPATAIASSAAPANTTAASPIISTTTAAAAAAAAAAAMPWTLFNNAPSPSGGQTSGDTAFHLPGLHSFVTGPGGVRHSDLLGMQPPLPLHTTYASSTSGGKSKASSGSDSGNTGATAWPPIAPFPGFAGSSPLLPMPPPSPFGALPGLLPMPPWMGPTAPTHPHSAYMPSPSQAYHDAVMGMTTRGYSGHPPQSTAPPLGYGFVPDATQAAPGQNYRIYGDYAGNIGAGNIGAPTVWPSYAKPVTSSDGPTVTSSSAKPPYRGRLRGRPSSRGRGGRRGGGHVATTSSASGGKETGGRKRIKREVDEDDNVEDMSEEDDDDDQVEANHASCDGENDGSSGGGVESQHDQSKAKTASTSTKDRSRSPDDHLTSAYYNMFLKERGPNKRKIKPKNLDELEEMFTSGGLGTSVAEDGDFQVKTSATISSVPTIEPRPVVVLKRDESRPPPRRQALRAKEQITQELGSATTEPTTKKQASKEHKKEAEAQPFSWFGNGKGGDDEDDDDDSEDEDYQTPKEDEGSVASGTNSSSSDSSSSADSDDDQDNEAKEPVTEAAAHDVTIGDAAGISVIPPDQYTAQLKQWREKEPDHCCVCLSPVAEEDNLLLFCENPLCDVAVHQQCYGIAEIPTDQWYCDKCQAKEPVRCVLCPNTEGAFKPTTTGEWVHIVCALWVPNVAFQSLEKMDMANVRKVDAKRLKGTCCLCTSPADNQVGAVINCDAGLCKNEMHATCAHRYSFLEEHTEDDKGHGSASDALSDEEGAGSDGEEQPSKRKRRSSKGSSHGKRKPESTKDEGRTMFYAFCEKHAGRPRKEPNPWFKWVLQRPSRYAPVNLRVPELVPSSLMDTVVRRVAAQLAAAEQVIETEMVRAQATNFRQNSVRRDILASRTHLIATINNMNMLEPTSHAATSIERPWNELCVLLFGKEDGKAVATQVLARPPPSRRNRRVAYWLQAPPKEPVAPSSALESPSTGKATSSSSPWATRGAKQRVCSNCHKIEYSGDRTGASANIIIVCTSCDRSFHLGCIEPPMKRPPSQGYHWRCQGCIEEEDKDLSEVEIPEDGDGCMMTIDEAQEPTARPAAATSTTQSPTSDNVSTPPPEGIQTRRRTRQAAGTSSPPRISSHHYRRSDD